MTLLKKLLALKNAELNETLEYTLKSVDLTSIGENLLTETTDETLEDIKDLLEIVQYIETDTVMESVISDDLYDQLHAKYYELSGGKSIVGTTTTSTTKPTKEHFYPELRGSLDKVHFILNSEIPEKDSRKSLEYWFNGVTKKCSDILPELYELTGDLKYDGLSGVFECTGNNTDDVVTRKDVDANIGVVVTHVFEDLDLTTLGLPDELFEKNIEFGLKTEMLVLQDDYEKFCNIVPNSRKPKNRRSAASMIINTSKDEFNPEWSKYITAVPLQISSKTKLGNDYEEWYYAGELNGRYQYMKFDLSASQLIIDTSKPLPINDIETVINACRDKAESLGIPIDGVVFTINNVDMVSRLGRSNNINKYQIAYKFPAGVKKTKIKNVEFLVGPIGTVTPLAEVEPVVIMGNTITNVSLSNYDKLDRLNIHIGDEVYVKYNIIPTLYKTDDCKEMDGKPIQGPTNCPSCNEPLTISNAIVRCSNFVCPARKVGIIYNYVNKMNIPNIGMSIIQDFVDIGIVNSIIDLYQLDGYKDTIINMPGYGEKSYNNIISAIASRHEVYPHELLGSLGIPDIGRTIMKKICTVIPFTDLLNIENKDSIISAMTAINGVGEITARKIVDGLDRYEELIHKLRLFLTIKEYDTEKNPELHVLFTNVRDQDFADYLTITYNAEIMKGYAKRVDVVIIPNDRKSSSKVEKAKEDGKLILTIDEAKSLYKYN